MCVQGVPRVPPQADLRASLYDLLEERDRLGSENNPKALVGCCSDQAKALHTTRAGK